MQTRHAVAAGLQRLPKANPKKRSREERERESDVLNDVDPEEVKQILTSKLDFLR